MIRSEYKIAIIINSYVLNESPILKNIANYLAEKSFKVDIFIDKYDYNTIHFIKNKNISINTPKYSRLRKIINSFKTRLNNKTYYLLVWLFSFIPKKYKWLHMLYFSCFHPFVYYTKLYSYYLNGKINDKYMYSIVVEPEGIMAYHKAKLNIPYVYLSLEINNLEIERKAIYNCYLRKLERQYLVDSLFTIIQDDQRKIELCKSLHLSLNRKFKFLPVSLRNQPKHIDQKNDFAYRKYKIPKNKIIILYAGSIMKWACLEELIKNSYSWDNKFVLIIHGGRIDKNYYFALKELSEKSENVILSTNWLSEKELKKLIQSSGIGICIYSDDTLNNRLTTFASHKLPTYYSNGIPVVTRDYPELKMFIEKNKCGRVFSNYNELENIFIEILEEYKAYQENAMKAFNEYYNFDVNFSDIYNYLSLLAQIFSLKSENIDITFKKEFNNKKDVINKILKYQDNEINIKLEERAFPGNNEFIESGYYAIMLKRYLFAGAYFCKDKKVLDSCCGLGWGTYLVAQYAKNIYAFDKREDVIVFCKREFGNSKIEWAIDDALSFTKKELFDVALGMETIEHFNQEDGEVYVRNIASNLKETGVFIGTTAIVNSRKQADFFCRRNPFHLHIYTLNEMLALLKKYFNSIKIIDNWMFIAVK